MKPSSSSIKAAVFLVGSIPFFVPTLASAAGPLSSFAGQWHGGGKIAMTDGRKENIRCKGAYAAGGGGLALTIDLTCASDSYRVNITSSIAAQGSSLSGQWQETTRQVQGDVSGRILGPGEIQASLEGAVFSMQLTAKAVDRRQALNLKIGGTEVDSVTIDLSR